MRTCSTCPAGSSPQDDSEFIGSRGFRSSCKSCYRRWAKEAYVRRKDDYKLRAKLRSAGLRDMVSRLKSGPCPDCSLSFPSWAMEFDHVSDKSGPVSGMLTGRFSREIILSEIQKCEAVCVLCHRLRTRERGYVGPAKDRLPDEERECPCAEHGLTRAPGCRGCKNASRLADYYRTRSRSNSRSVVLKRSRREDSASGLKSGPCLDCERRLPPVCMDFDHVRGEKTSNVSRLMADFDLALSDEVAKCDLVCAVCHRYRTLSRGGKNSPEDDAFMLSWISPSSLAV